MQQAANGLSEQDFLYGHLADYLDGELSPDQQGRFEAAMKKENDQLALHFQETRGRLQIALQSYYLKEGELASLRALVEDPSVQKDHENQKIEQIGRKELAGTMIRRAVLLGLAATVIGYMVWRFAPKGDVRFKSLEYLGYEAEAMIEDPEGRLDLPTDNIDEISQYLMTYPSLGFEAPVLKPLAKGWKPEGTAVIDYEVAKVSVVQYGSEELQEKLFHFAYQGSLGDLPPAEPGNMRGLVYQTYETEYFNIIAWQHSDSVVSMLAGHRSAPELAELALIGGGKR